MNAIFVSQSGTIKMFHDLALDLQREMEISEIGMVVSHRRSVKTFKKKHPGNLLKQFNVLSEWDITNSHKDVIVDHKLLEKYEQDLNVQGFRQALMVDRRINNGKKCTYFQDYKSRFSEHEQLQILQQSLIEVERLFDQVKPDFIVSFICVTLVEYLCNLFAKSRGIKILNIRPTRIGNYMTFGSDITEPSNFIRDRYLSISHPNPETPFYEEATKIFNESRTSNYTYEGTSMSAKFSIPAKVCSYTLKVFKAYKLLNMALIDLRIKYGDLRDNHDPGIIKPLYYEIILKPLLKLQIRKVLKKKYLKLTELNDHNYIFFPLHTEPEKALLVDAPFYTNQIEVIRNISLSLPANTILIVKDHPKSFGKRPISFYNKILDIPNVRLIEPLLPTAQLVKQCQLVITIAGSVGWEGILHEKPVMILGNTPYEFLPDQMVTKISNITDLPKLIASAIDNYMFDKEAVIRYLIASLTEAVPLNYYSILLSRTNVNSKWSLDADWDSEINKLSAYTQLSLDK